MTMVQARACDGDGVSDLALLDAASIAWKGTDTALRWLRQSGSPVVSPTTLRRFEENLAERFVQSWSAEFAAQGGPFKAVMLQLENFHLQKCSRELRVLASSGVQGALDFLAGLSFRLVGPVLARPPGLPTTLLPTATGAIDRALVEEQLRKLVELAAQASSFESMLGKMVATSKDLADLLARQPADPQFLRHRELLAHPILEVRSSDRQAVLREFKAPVVKLDGAMTFSPDDMELLQHFREFVAKNTAYQFNIATGLPSFHTHAQTLGIALNQSCAVRFISADLFVLLNFRKDHFRKKQADAELALAAAANTPASGTERGLGFPASPEARKRPARPPEPSTRGG